MLAASWEPGTIVKYPVLVSPKIDGIRCIIHPELGPVSRTFKPIRNTMIRDWLSGLPSWFDGELVFPGNFQKTASTVMSEFSPLWDKIEYWVFDWAGPQEYAHRVNALKASIQTKGVRNVAAVSQQLCTSDADLMALEEYYLANGFEGICYRTLKSPYKSGRSTLNQQWLVKIKRFEDAEATIIGFEEEMENANLQTRDAFGLAERSSHKDSKYGKGRLGALVVQTNRGVFNVGSGFTHQQRQEIWDKREGYLGKTITYKFFPIGIKDLPRHPIFKAVRED
jgi:DNA ligase-1